MTPEQFAYWLNGYVELNNGTIPNEVQWRSITDHLKTVFNKVTPDRYLGTPVPGPTIGPFPPALITC